MVDSNIKDLANNNANNAPDITHKLQLDTNQFITGSNHDTMGTGTKIARVGQVTLEGLAETPAGIVHAAENFVKPENWGKDAMMIGSSAVMGMALRTLLPESGAIKTAAGLIMGGLFIKDGLTPMVGAWGSVTKDGSQQAMRDAARQMGDGLGDFAVSGTISMAAAGFAANKTPALWEKFSPETWGKIEGFKSAHLAETAPLSVKLSDLHQTFSSKLGSFADTIDPKKPTAVDLGPQRLVEVAKQAADNQGKANLSETLYRHGLQGADGHAHGFDSTLDLLLSGKDPRTVAASGEIATPTNAIATTDLSKPGVLAVGEQPASGIGTAKDVLGKRSGIAANTDAIAKANDGAGDNTSGGGTTDAKRILNVKTMTAQASVIRAHLGAISDEQGLVMDAINRTTGAVEVRTNPSVKPLMGYNEPREAMLSLAQQVGTDPGSYGQVANLFDRFSDASIQSGTEGVSDIGAHIARFNTYAKENLTTYERNIMQAGIDPKVALQRKIVAPLGEATSDLEQIGVDKSGNPVYAHEGPHTVRAIYGPKGEPIWPVDLVKYPVREIELRGVQTSGIYGHELMHDQFGRLGEFDPEVRDAKLGEAATKALGSEATKTVDVPNGGLDPQQVLLNNIERKASSITDVATKDAYLSDALQMDPQSRVYKGAMAADKILGDVGQQSVQVPQVGAVPLDVFVANIAAMADTRTPTEVLAEAQGHGDPAATRAAISKNIDSKLGPNGDLKLPLPDGTETTLKDVVLQVSDATRNPQFRTYGEPLPKTMTYQDLMVAVAKATADEVFADWGAAAESGQSAAPYFQALRKDGLLSNATVMGQDMRSPDNPLGIEAHPVDKLRPRYQSALIRALATAKGGHDQVLLDWADALDQYSRDAGKPGDITFASMDAPGQKITVPEPAMDKFITELANQQINTPLPRLQGRTLLDILPDLRKNFRVNDTLSNQWVDAIKAGKAPDTVSFDKANTKITHVFGAGQLAFLKLVADGMDPLKANDAVNQFSDFFGNQFLSGDPHAQTPFFKKLQIAPGHTLREIPTQLTAPLASGLRAEPQAASWLNKYAFPIAGGSAALQVQDLLGMHQLQQNVVGDGTSTDQQAKR